MGYLENFLRYHDNQSMDRSINQSINQSIYYRYPWGKEAFDKAKKENKPIFLSGKDKQKMLPSSVKK